MKLADTPIVSYDNGDHFKNIALFKKVAISPKNNEFLSSKITVRNYCLMVIESGNFEWKLNDVIYNLKPKDLVLVAPDTQMEKIFKNIEVGSFYKISLNYNFYHNLNQNLSGHTSLSKTDINTIFNRFAEKGSIVLPHCNDLYENFKNLEKEYLLQQIGFTAKVNGIVDDMIISSFRKCFTENEFREVPLHIKNLIYLVKENLSHPWTVREMAENSNLGITKFSEILKNYTGYSPFDFIIYLRIKESIKLLKGSDKSLTDIAFQTGFYSSQHFSNTFKKVVGYPPKEFRKNVV
jgi:AraC-like DNA-binding protein